VTQPDNKRPSETSARELSEHIFSVSAALVGVCLTVIGIFRLVSRSAHVDSVADNLLAIDALIFLVACLLSYLGLRARSSSHRHGFERAADVAFLAGLTMMVVVGALVAYEVI
jgi:divalent metal cation (Fe/Co/Zn/Cd) transporter